MLIGSGSEGSGTSLALVDIVLGDQSSAVAGAWTAALASPSAGHSPFLVVAEPGLPVKPFTLFVPKVTSSGFDHEEVTRGAAQAGVAAGVIDALRTGVIPTDVAQHALLICSVWVDSAVTAVHADLIYANNRAATVEALDAAGHEWPPVERFIETTTRVWNPNYQS